MKQTIPFALFLCHACLWQEYGCYVSTVRKNELRKLIDIGYEDRIRKTSGLMGHPTGTTLPHGSSDPQEQQEPNSMEERFAKFLGDSAGYLDSVFKITSFFPSSDKAKSMGKNQMLNFSQYNSSVFALANAAPSVDGGVSSPSTAYSNLNDLRGNGSSKHLKKTSQSSLRIGTTLSDSSNDKLVDSCATTRNHIGRISDSTVASSAPAAYGSGSTLSNASDREIHFSGNSFPAHALSETSLATVGTPPTSASTAELQQRGSSPIQRHGSKRERFRRFVTSMLGIPLGVVLFPWKVVKKLRFRKARTVSGSSLPAGTVASATLSEDDGAQPRGLFQYLVRAVRRRLLIYLDKSSSGWKNSLSIDPLDGEGGIFTASSLRNPPAASYWRVSRAPPTTTSATDSYSRDDLKSFTDNAWGKDLLRSNVRVNRVRQFLNNQVGSRVRRVFFWFSGQDGSDYAIGNNSSDGGVLAAREALAASSSTVPNVLNRDKRRLGKIQREQRRQQRLPNSFAGIGRAAGIDSFVFGFIDEQKIKLARYGNSFKDSAEKLFAKSSSFSSDPSSSLSPGSDSMQERSNVNRVEDEVSSGEWQLVAGGKKLLARTMQFSKSLGMSLTRAFADIPFGGFTNAGADSATATTATGIVHSGRGSGEVPTSRRSQQALGESSLQQRGRVERNDGEREEAQLNGGGVRLSIPFTNRSVQFSLPWDVFYRGEIPFFEIHTDASSSFSDQLPTGIPQAHAAKASSTTSAAGESRIATETPLDAAPLTFWSDNNTNDIGSGIDSTNNGNEGSATAEGKRRLLTVSLWARLGRFIPLLGLVWSARSHLQSEPENDSTPASALPSTAVRRRKTFNRTPNTVDASLQQQRQQLEQLGDHGEGLQSDVSEEIMNYTPNIDQNQLISPVSALSSFGKPSSALASSSSSLPMISILRSDVDSRENNAKRAKQDEAGVASGGTDVSMNTQSAAPATPRSPAVGRSGSSSISKSIRSIQLPFPPFLANKPQVENMQGLRTESTDDTIIATDQRTPRAKQARIANTRGRRSKPLVPAADLSDVPVFEDASKLDSVGTDTNLNGGAAAAAAAAVSVTANEQASDGVAQVGGSRNEALRMTPSFFDRDNKPFPTRADFALIRQRRVEVAVAAALAIKSSPDADEFYRDVGVKPLFSAVLQLVPDSSRIRKVDSINALCKLLKHKSSVAPEIAAFPEIIDALCDVMEVPLQRRFYSFKSQAERNEELVLQYEAAALVQRLVRSSDQTVVHLRESPRLVRILRQIVESNDEIGSFRIIRDPTNHRTLIPAIPVSAVDKDHTSKIRDGVLGVGGKQLAKNRQASEGKGTSKPVGNVSGGSGSNGSGDGIGAAGALPAWKGKANTTVVDFPNLSTKEMARVAMWGIGGVPWKPKRAGQRGLRILSLDGGGTRGVISIAYLKELMREIGNGAQPHEYFDIVCGTSTGGIIAALIGAQRRTVRESEALYDDFIDKVFGQKSNLKLVTNQAFYDEIELEKIIYQMAGDALLLDSNQQECPRVFFVSTQCNRNPPEAHVWRNYNYPPGQVSRYPGAYRVNMQTSVRATTAAPTFFTSVQWGGNLYIDGAIVANNPTAIALQEAKVLYPNVPVEMVVSIGTGYISMDRNVQSMWWDVLVDQLIASSTATEDVHKLLVDLLPNDKYFRFNPLLKDNLAIDEKDKNILDNLKKIVREDFQHVVKRGPDRKRYEQLIKTLRGPIIK